MKESFRSNVSISRLLNGGEGAYANVGVETANGIRRYPHREVMFALSGSFVLHIVVARYIAKILNAIVARISVDVVDLPSRPFAMDVKPCQSMLGIPLLVDLKNVIVLKAAGNVANLNLSNRNPPLEKSSFWEVNKKFAQALSSQFSHLNLIRVHRKVKLAGRVMNPSFRPLKLGQPLNLTIFSFPRATP